MPLTFNKGVDPTSQNRYKNFNIITIVFKIRTLFLPTVNYILWVNSKIMNLPIVKEC
jgi:hypothetical protein